MADEIPEVTIYVKDKWILSGHFLAGIIAVLAVARKPSDWWDFMLLIAAVVGGGINPLLSRLRATPKQAGAIMFAKETMRRLPTEEIQSINAAVERKEQFQKDAGIR
jgi:hypothetical protein